MEGGYKSQSKEINKRLISLEGTQATFHYFIGSGAQTAAFYHSSEIHKRDGNCWCLWGEMDGHLNFIVVPATP